MKSFPMLLTVNPELQRNLWLELSPGRVLGMPLVIALLTGAVYEISGKDHLFGMISFILWMLLIVWGPWLAATTVIEEIMARTWDVQRLSAQSARNLIIGKFIGGTIYVWYGALLCLIATVALASDHLDKVLDTVLGGLLAQSMAMFSAMIIARRGNGMVKRSSSVLAILIGVTFAGFFGTMIGIGTGEIVTSASVSDSVAWYGLSIPTAAFWHGLEALVTLWILYGSVRLMRRELGYRDGPWGWLAFTLFTVVFVGGWKWPVKTTTDQSWQGRIFLDTVAMTYVALLGLPVAIAASRKFFAAVKKSDWRSAWPSTPSWVPAAMLSAIGALGFAATNADHALGAVALLGFLCRDIIVVYAFRIRFVRRSEAALVLYFGLIYLFSSFVTTVGYHPIANATQALVAHAFLPITGTPIGIGAAFPWLEALVFYVLFRKDIGRLSPRQI